MSVLSFYAPQLNEDQLGRWREFVAQAPAAHYLQDPPWAEVERRGTGF